MEQTTTLVENVRRAYGENVEVRTAEVVALERSEENGPMVLEGYAAVYDEPTTIGDGRGRTFTERVERGAFAKVLRDDVRLLVNHTGVPFARTTNNTLQLVEDERGLKFRAELNPENTAARDLYGSIRRGDISQCSFACDVPMEAWTRDKDGTRVIREVRRMWDISAVTMPAYTGTTVVARSVADAMAAPVEPETEATATEPVERSEDVENTTPDVDKEEETAAPMATAKRAENTRTFRATNLVTMNVNELKALRAKAFEEHGAIVAAADQDNRPLTEAEEQRAEYLVGEVARLDQKIRHKADHETMVANAALHGGTGITSRSEQNEVDRVNRSFSISRAIMNVANNRALDGAENEWMAEAQREAKTRGLQITGNVAIPMRAITRAGETDLFATTDTVAGDAGGKGFVPTNVGAGIDALRAPSALQRLGATVLTDATGNIQFPRVGTKGVGADAAENAASTAAGIQLDEVELKPERITAYTAYTKQLLLQGGTAVDGLIYRELIGAINEKMDTNGFADIMADANVNVVGTMDANTTFNAGVAYAMEAAILADGADLSGASYVMSPKAFELSKGVAAVTGVTPLWDGGRFNNYGAIATPWLANDLLADGTTVGGTMLMLNAAQGIVMAMFGPLDLLVDPFTNATNNQIKLWANRYWDLAIRQPGAIAKVDQLASA